MSNYHTRSQCEGYSFNLQGHEKSLFEWSKIDENVGNIYEISLKVFQDLAKIIKYLMGVDMRVTTHDTER